MLAPLNFLIAQNRHRTIAFVSLAKSIAIVLIGITAGMLVTDRRLTGVALGLAVATILGQSPMPWVLRRELGVTLSFLLRPLPMAAALLPVAWVMFEPWDPWVRVAAFAGALVWVAASGWGVVLNPVERARLIALARQASPITVAA